MKGLESIPQSKDLVAAYNQLQSGPLDETKLIGNLSFARFDPRLAEILVEKVATDWQKIDPYKLNTQLINLPWPATLGVILENAQALLPKTLKLPFNRWKKFAMTDVRPASGELFWIGVFTFGSNAVRAQFEKSLKPYLRWGYFGDEWLANKARSKKPSKTLISQAHRMRVLKEVAETLPRFYLKDYLHALSHQVQKRTAELDLKNADFLTAHGRTRARVYRLKKSRSV